MRGVELTGIPLNMSVQDIQLLCHGLGDLVRTTLWFGTGGEGRALVVFSRADDARAAIRELDAYPVASGTIRARLVDEIVSTVKVTAMSAITVPSSPDVATPPPRAKRHATAAPEAIDNRAVWLGNLDGCVSAEDVRNVMNYFGPCQEVYMPKLCQSNGTRWAVARFLHWRHAAAAMATLEAKTYVHGLCSVRPFKIKYYTPPEYARHSQTPGPLVQIHA